MTPTLTAFERSPDGGKGLSRDTRVRWALEELGLAYDVELVSFTALKEPAYRALHPFGQIPVYRDGDLTLFESGSIILHLAGQHPGLLPADPDARARAITWMFAALSTVEPPIVEFSFAWLFERDKPWAAKRMALIEPRVHTRLRELAAHLGEADWLDGDFSAGDLMMVHVLQRLKPSGLINAHPSLVAYLARAEARPAFQRARAAQQAIHAQAG